MKPLLLLLALACCAPAREPVSASEDGAAPSVAEIDARVRCVHRARDGALWLGTDGGAYRDDGERRVRSTRADGLPGERVSGFVEDGRGNLLATTDAGVACFDGTAWRALEVERAAPGEGWVLDPDDAWLVVEPGQRGPCRFDGERLLRLVLPESPAAAAHRARVPSAAYAADGVYCVTRDRRGAVWIGTAGVGLCRFDGEEHAWLVEDRLSVTPRGGEFGLRAVHEDARGDFWISNTRQRFRFAPGSTERDGFRLLEFETRPGLPDAAGDASPGFTYFHAVAEDAAGVLWFACGSDGVWRFDGEHVTRHDLGADASAVWVHLDRDGTVRAGAPRHGVHVLDGERFVPFAVGPVRNPRGDR